MHFEHPALHVVSLLQHTWSKWSGLITSDHLERMCCSDTSKPEGSTLHVKYTSIKSQFSSCHDEKLVKPRFVQHLFIPIQRVCHRPRSNTGDQIWFGQKSHFLFDFSFVQIVHILHVSRFTQQHKGSDVLSGNRDFWVWRTAPPCAEKDTVPLQR